jgi:hypothetical protein
VSQDFIQTQSENSAQSPKGFGIQTNNPQSNPTKTGGDGLMLQKSTSDRNFDELHQPLDHDCKSQQNFESSTGSTPSDFSPPKASGRPCFRKALTPSSSSPNDRASRMIQHAWLIETMGIGSKLGPTMEDGDTKANSYTV